jgi:hypothetical protein
LDFTGEEFITKISDVKNFTDVPRVPIKLDIPDIPNILEILDITDSTGFPDIMDN